MRLRALASGSGGNCLIATSAGGGTRIMVDLGISRLTAEKRMAGCGINPDSIDAVLFTHEHSDHTSGAAKFHDRHPSTPFYANCLTAEAICGDPKSPLAISSFRCFQTGESFEIGDFDILPVPICHDTVDPVAFLISDGASSLAVITDTGRTTPDLCRIFSSADCAVLEANYDPQLLWGSRRHDFLKRRIAGDTGHLSNEDAAEFVRDNASARLKILLAAHRSRECNSASLVVAALQNALDCSEAAGADFALLEQSEPSALWEF